MPEEEYHRRLVEMMLSGEVRDKAALQRAKVRLCRELGLDSVPPTPRP